MTDVNTPGRALCADNIGAPTSQRRLRPPGPGGAWDRCSLAASAATSPTDTLILDFGPPEPQALLFKPLDWGILLQWP